MNSKPKLNGLANLVRNPMKLLMDTYESWNIRIQRMQSHIRLLQITNYTCSLMNRNSKVLIGYDENEEANQKDMSMYYSDDEIKENGVVGIEVKLYNK